MDIENKLDDDFLFYTNFSCTFLKRINDSDIFRKCRNWILKLCTDSYEGVEMKRCRNMYLSNLLVHMQSGKLDEPFLRPPAYVDISDAIEVFGGIPSSVEKPDWLNDSEYTATHRESPSDKSGRTYFASRTLPNGQGAFAYIGVSLTGDDWTSPSLAAGDTSTDRHQAVDQMMSQRYREEVPSYEMEKILAKRKNPKERERVLTFYDTLLQIVSDELSGKEAEYNETVEGLLEQLIEDLKEKGQYDHYSTMDDYNKRMELLMTLYDRIKIRRDKVATREEILDDIEQKVIPQLFDVTQVDPEDQYQLPAAMWQQAIEKMPSRNQMAELKQMYPIPVVEKFIVLLAEFKEEIAERMHRRHETIATQMKKELRKESTKKQKEAERMQQMCLDTEDIYRAVYQHCKKIQDVLDYNMLQKKLPMKEHTRLYEDLKAAALDTQKLVEEEAARGKFVAEQINKIAENGEVIREINDDSIKKCEDVNAKILRNIRRLNHAIKMYEKRIADIKSVGDSTMKNVKNMLDGKDDY